MNSRINIPLFKWVLYALFLALFSTLLHAQDSSEASRGPSRVPSYTGEGAAGCLMCHSRERMHAIKEGLHGNDKNPSSPLSQQSCEACHGPGSIHVSRAHGGTGFPPLVEFGRGKKFSPRDMQVDACLTCHEDEYGHATLIGFRESVHNRKNINCSTCHEIHAAEDPSRITDIQNETCFRCHRKVKTEHPKKGKREINFDRIKCARCHDVHEYHPEPDPENVEQAP